MTTNFAGIAQENPELVADLDRFDKRATVPLLASLLTLPEHQSQCYRLELLVVLALLHCEGEQRPTHSDLARWYQLIGDSHSVSGEDAAEDVFVTLVDNSGDDFLLLEGIWEAAGFYTQRVLDVVATMPDNEHYDAIRRSVRAILRLSNAICARASLKRYQLGSEDFHDELQLDSGTNVDLLAERVVFTQAALDELDISFDDLLPFLITVAAVEELESEAPGISALERHPLIQVGDEVIVALPTAISIALRGWIIQFVQATDMTHAFDQSLANAYAQVIHDTPLLGGYSRANLRWIEHEGGQIAQISLNLGAGHFLLMLFVLPGIRNHGVDGFMGMYSDEGELAGAIESASNQARRQFESRPDFQRGLFINVVCGWGIGYSHVERILDDPKWQTETMSGADLVRLSFLVDMNPNAFWRLKDAISTIERAGVTILNLNGILNLYGWAEQNDGHLVPHHMIPVDRITPDTPLLLPIPLNLLRDVRAKADHSYDRHHARDHLGVSHLVQCASADTFFPSNDTARTYVSLNDLEQHKLTAVFEGTPCLWVTIEAPNMADNSVHFHLWQMVCTWLPRIGNALSKRDFPQPWLTIPKKIYVTFLDSGESRDLIASPSVQSLDDLCEVISHIEANAIEAVFKPGFLNAFKDPNNIAERALVRTIARGLITPSSEANAVEEARAIEIEVVRNDQERSFHVFQGHSVSDFLAHSLPDPLISIDRLDDAAIRVGLGWRALDAGASGNIVGKEACGTFLKKIVDELLLDITNELAQLDRTMTIERLTRNCEVANVGERKWRNTSAAVLALHSDFSDLRRTIVERMSQYSASRTTSRVVMELALCISPPQGGRVPSDIVLSKLLARISNVIRIGGYADAIHFNALPAEIQVSALGDILIRDSLGALVVNPMLMRAMNDGFDYYASRSAIYYAEPAVAEESKDEFDPVFWQAWKSETGFDIDQGRKFVDALETEALSRQEVVFLLKRSELEAIGVNAGLPRDSAVAFIDQFTLATRPKWDRVPNGFAMRDIYPWRYGRRLSAITRPLLQVDDTSDPAIVVAPGVLRQGFGYVASSAYHGRFAPGFFQSNEMRNTWYGRAGEGHTFNRDLAEALRAAGWEVRQGLGFPELLRQSTNRDYGDIDVFAWRQDRADVLVVECKDLSFARNYSEVAALLSEYQGDELDCRPDKLKRHLNRVQLANAKISDVARFTGVDKPSIVSWLVFSGVTPMHYADIEALKGTHVGLTKDIVEF
jgi:hypothetical protein